MKIKYIIILSIILLTSCKTKYILTENVRNTRDSVENVTLKQVVAAKETVLQNALFQAKTAEKKASDLIEKLNISESEKQLLKESFETVVKEYNEQGTLIKESYSKRTSELTKDINRIEQINRELQVTNNSQSELITYYTTEIKRTYDMNLDLTKKVQLLEQENSDLKNVKQSKAKFAWWLLIIGFAGGIAFYFYFERIVGWVIKFTKK